MNVLNYEIKDFFTEIYLKSELDTINNLARQGYDFDKLNIHTKHYKILFFNYISRYYIEAIKANNKVFYIIGKPVRSELYDYAPKNEIEYSYFLNMNKIFKLYPMNALISEDYTFDEYMEEHEDEITPLLTKEIFKCKNKNAKKSFAKLHSFIKTYDLAYLDKQLFEEVQTRFMFS